MTKLTSREWIVGPNWYAPLNLLLYYKNVVKAAHYDTTSSAGDWGGYFIQQTSKCRYALILFWQENRYPKRGYKVNTDNKVLHTFKALPRKEEILSVINDLVIY